MSQQIGPVTVKLTADATGVKGGVDAAVKTVEEGGGKIGEAAEKAGKSFGERLGGGIKGFTDKLKGGLSGILGLGASGGGLIEKALGNPGRFLADNIVGTLGDLANRVPIFGPLLALPFEGAATAMTAALDIFDAGKQRIKDLGAAAAAANVDLHQFQIISAAMGTDLAVTSTLLVKMQRSLREMALAGPGANNALTRLGLDAADLSRMGVDRAFGFIGDRLDTLGSRFLQTAYASEIFGRGVAGAMGALMRGTAGVDKIRSLVEGFGAGVGVSDFGNIRNIEMATKQIKLLKEGLSNQVTVGVGAVLAELADRVPKLTEFGITFKGVAQAIVDVLEGAARFGVGLSQVFTNSTVREELWNMFAGLAKAFGNTLLMFLQEGVGRVLSSIGKVKLGYLGEADFGAAGKRVLQGADYSQARQWQGLTGTMSAWSRFQEALTGGTAFEAVGRFFTGVRDRLAQTGQSGRENDPFAFWLESAGRLQERLESQSPLDKLKQSVLEVQNLTQKGPGMADLFAPPGANLMGATPRAWAPFFEGGDANAAGALFPGLAEKAAYGIFSGLKNFVPSMAPIGAMEKGSKEAYSTITAYQGSQAVSVQDAIKAAVQEMARQQAEEVRIGREMLEAIRDGQLAVGGLP